MEKPVDLAKLIAEPCEGERILLTGLPDGRVMVQSTFRDNDFLLRMLRVALCGSEKLAAAEREADEKEARAEAKARRKRRPRPAPRPGEIS